MPVLEEIPDSLGDNNSVFSTPDLCSGFCQVPLTPESREKTVFSTPSGHSHYRRMPMGLVGSPSTFKHLINSVFTGLLGNMLFCHHDDIIVFSKTVSYHLEKLHFVFTRLADSDLKLKLSAHSFRNKWLFSVMSSTVVAFAHHKISSKP